MSAMVMNTDLNNVLNDDIDNMIKTISNYKASCVKNVIFDAYKIIMSHDDALSVASNEYTNTYNKFYEQLTKLYKSKGNDLKINEFLNYQLIDTLSTTNNEIPIIKNEIPIIKNTIVENKLAIKNTIVENTLAIKNTIVENNSWYSPKTRQIILNSDLPPPQTPKIIKKLNTHQNSTKFDLKQKIIEISKNYAREIITDHNINIGESITINCKDNDIIETINGTSILKSKFLDSTYVDTNNKTHTSIHYNFKKEFLKILEELYGKEHNLHVNFIKDYNNDMIYNIYFSENFKNQMNLSNNNLGTKIIIKKK
jgi:hypothetical protein